MKIQIQAGYWVTNKFQVQVGSGTSPHKTLPRATCITGEVSHWHKSFEYVSITASNFSESFCIPSLWRDSNQSILSMRLAGTTTDLIPYPFLSGVEEQIPVLPGGIQAPVSSLVHTMYQDWLQENIRPKSAKLCQVPGLIIHINIYIYIYIYIFICMIRPGTWHNFADLGLIFSCNQSWYIVCTRDETGAWIPPGSTGICSSTPDRKG